MKRLFQIAFIQWLVVCMLSFTAGGSTVSELTALYQNGQVFLAWKNVSNTGKQYNVYRSLVPILTSAQLTSSNYLGYVRDNSGQNIRKSQIKNSNYYFVITDNEPPLASNRGLYVVTCTSPSFYYYAVTVTNLSDNQEDQTIIVGSNSLLLPVSESVAAPQAVLQTITSVNNGDVSYEYVIWGNNQDVSHWHAFNNVGSYGYNFALIKRGNSSNQPLCILFQDQNPFKKIGTDFCSDCNILQLDDWIPNGENTYWVGYNDSYNMYLSNSSNPVVTSGTVKTYTQVRTQAIIRWSKRQPNIDSNRVYMTGNSHNGFGAMLTAMHIPSEISSLYLTVTPIIYKTKAGDKREHQFCKVSSNIPTDVNYPGTANPIVIWEFMDMRTWYRINIPQGVPYIQAIHGKNDTKAGYPQKYHWYDTLNAYHQGGTWYWDQRTHNGDNAQFLTSETKTDYTRYYTNQSYPAFAFCTINQDPGDGDAADGDPYGAINGYLDWDNNSIVDQTCTYSINCFVKTFYVGGEADVNQYSSGLADVTLRRTQNFHPESGQIINWTNYDVNNKLLSSGSFVYDGEPITLDQLKIKETGSTITLTIEDCFGFASGTTITPENCSLIKTAEGYFLKLSTTYPQNADIDVFDLMGRSVLQLDVEVQAGVTSIPLKLPPGLYLVKAASKEIYFTGKMAF